MLTQHASHIYNTKIYMYDTVLHEASSCSATTPNQVSLSQALLV
jgi:hypothetical protein